MNTITTAKLAEMVATIIAGMMANPANGQTEMNGFNMSTTVTTVTQQVQSGLTNIGISIVDE